MCRRRRRLGACKPSWCVRHRPQRRRFGHAAQQPRSWAHATRATPLRGVSCSRSAGHFFPRRLFGAADAGFAAAACAEQGCSTCGATGANGRRVDPLVLRRAPSSLAPDSARQLGRWQELPHGAVFERPVPAVSGERAPRASWGSSCSLCLKSWVCVCVKKNLGTLLLKSWDSLAWARDVVDGTIKQRRRIRVRACEPASAPADKRRRSNACAGSGRRRAARNLLRHNVRTRAATSLCTHRHHRGGAHTAP